MSVPHLLTAATRNPPPPCCILRHIRQATPAGRQSERGLRASLFPSAWSSAVASTSQIVGALLARLRGAAPQLTVEYFAGAEDDYPLAHPQGAALLCLRGSQFGPLRDGYGQVRTLQLAITVLLNQRDAGLGDCDALDAIRRACLGFALPDCQPAWLLSETFLGYRDGVARYAIALATDTLQVTEADPEPVIMLNAVSNEEQP
nr:Gp37 family protein [Chromobacterium violaceum]